MCSCFVDYEKGVAHICGLEETARAIQRRDPLGVGYHDKWGLDLLMRLLHVSTYE